MLKTGDGVAVRLYGGTSVLKLGKYIGHPEGFNTDFAIVEFSSDEIMMIRMEDIIVVDYGSVVDQKKRKK